MSASREGTSRGAALYMVVIFLAVTAMGSIAFSMSFANLVRETARARESREAFYAALGGIEAARAHLRRDPAYAGGDVSVGPGRASVRVARGAGGGGVYEVTVSGRIESAHAPGTTIERRILATLRLSGGRLPEIVSRREE